MTSLPVLPASAVARPPDERVAAWSESERREVARALANAVEGEVRFDPHNRMLYATDASLYQVEPLGVVIPSSVDDAARVVAFCNQHSLPLLPRGGGTSLAGQCTSRAIVMDLSVNCRRVIELDESAGRCHVEPGITVDDLNEAIARTGWFFAPDPATSRHANIGGCIGNNAAGARSIRHGRTSESVLGIDAMLIDGTRVRLERGAGLRDERVRDLTCRIADIITPVGHLIKERFPKTIRRNAGYGLDMILAQMESSPGGFRGDLAEVNLAHLLCGSEGTLAVTLGAELKLHRIPKAKGLAVLGFSDLDEAIAHVVPILSTHPSAVELLDDTVIDLARANAEYRRYVELMPQPANGRALKAVLYVEYFSETGLDEITGSKFPALSRRSPGIAVQHHTHAGAMLSAWKLRKAGEPLLHGVPGHRKPITFIEDNAVPVERLGEFVKRLRTIVQGYGTKAAFWAHASVGVLHVRPMLDIHEPHDRTIMQRIAVETADLAKELGGVMSGEHGDGRVRGPLLERFYGPEIMAAFRAVKALFDPRNLLNPGNIVEPRPIESISEKLRVEPAPESPVHVPLVRTYFDYEDQHGFGSAVEMCNGAGVCRKKLGGTMCPSYMATLDERHSTRGRGNALRLAITGQLLPLPEGGGRGVGSDPASIWSDPSTIETLNLCLSCKACKTECPSNVDIARLKAEYTAQRYREQGGAPLSAKLIGNVRFLNRAGAWTPRLANWMKRTGLAKWALGTLAHIDPRRDVPAFARSLARDFRGENTQDPGPHARAVALFGDCFVMYNEPGIGRSTKRVLEAFGYHVELADAGCCARPRISTGQLADAIDEIDATLRSLAPWIVDDSVEAILVAEPSCLSAFKDDWLGLNCRSPIHLRRKLAEKAMLPEQFLERHWDRHPRRPNFRAAADPVLLHGHCHQKALWGVETSAAFLRRLVGDQLKVLDTGCCGMAGSFGYTTDRYDLSMKIGELTLFPAVRAASDRTTIAAPGTSCRHQIHDGTHTRALHPIEVIDRLLS